LAYKTHLIKKNLNKIEKTVLVFKEGVLKKKKKIFFLFFKTRG
jgi:hypothetical protein